MALEMKLDLTLHYKPKFCPYPTPADTNQQWVSPFHPKFLYETLRGDQVHMLYPNNVPTFAVAQLCAPPQTTPIPPSHPYPITQLPSPLWRVHPPPSRGQRTL